MAKLKKNFYIGKGKDNEHPWLYYGSKPPTIVNNKVRWDIFSTELIGPFTDNPIAESIEDNEIIKLYIRKETIKNKKNE